MNQLFAVAKISVTLTFLIFPLFYGAFLRRKNKLTADALCGLLLISGAALRFLYILYTDASTRQHDVGDLLKQNSGHTGYMLYLLFHKSLPDFDPRGYNQFYHPPLHHVIGALVFAALRAMGLRYRVIGGEILQLFTAVYSAVFSVLMYKTLRLLDIKGKPLVLCTAVGAFHPTLIILAGSINNDILSIMLGMAAVYFTVRWSRSLRFSDIIAAALSMGLGMMTKLSVGLLAPAMAAVFLTVFIKQRKQWAKLLGEFASFASVCVPLGMWWPVRNLVRFGVPINYVPPIGSDSGQYIDVPTLKRLLDFSPQLIKSPFTQWEWYGDPYNEYNPVIALLKNAMFDEDMPFIGSITLQSFCTALFFAGAVTAIISVAAVALVFSKKIKLPFELRLMLCVMYAVVFGSYIVFCLNYPQVCTQNMRYCVPLIFSGTAAMGLMMQREGRSGRAVRLLSRAAKMAIASMCALSAFVYTAEFFWEAFK